LANARAGFAYDVSEEIKTSANLVNGYADEALRAAGSCYKWLSGSHWVEQLSTR
jgi:hypothetical protein